MLLIIFALALATKTYFQKIADPADMAEISLLLSLNIPSLPEAGNEVRIWNWSESVSSYAKLESDAGK